MFSTLIEYILGLFRQYPPFKVVNEPVSLEKMTKKDLDKLGEKNGIRLDRRRTKEYMIDQLRESGITHGYK